MEIDRRQIVREFEQRYSSAPRLFRAPGRVNLIGEHTDYNEGFVMPFAIDRETVVAAAPRNDALLNVYAKDMDESTTIDLAGKPHKRRGTWVDYVEGTARSIANNAGFRSGADMIVTSTVPIGAGLSSSAAIEVAVGYALLAINETSIDRRRLAFAAQRAEHEYVGIRSGIMDQFAAAFSRQGMAMLLDCRSLDIDYIPIEKGGTAIVVIDTKVKHSLASTEYNERREECEQGVELLSRSNPTINSLRDVSVEELEANKGVLPEVVLKRCRHVLTENARTLEAADAFRRSNFERAGQLMFESHRSLRDDYEVSCPELDLLVDVASEVNGVYGSRMTGGGFGGCTVSLVDRPAVDELRIRAVSAYQLEYKREPEVYMFRTGSGASELGI